MIISCLSKELKQVIKDKLENKALDELITGLETIPACKGSPIGFSEGADKKRKQKREPSEYQKFIGACMKEKKVKSFSDAPIAMKNCAREWRELRG